jgi:hypothetical protein
LQREKRRHGEVYISRCRANAITKLHESSYVQRWRIQRNPVRLYKTANNLIKMGIFR